MSSGVTLETGGTIFAFLGGGKREYRAASIQLRVDIDAGHGVDGLRLLPGENPKCAAAG